jgi:hypothetical protein
MNEEEQDDMVLGVLAYCPACAGHGFPLGQLGRMFWWRCQQCGTDFGQDLAVCDICGADIPRGEECPNVTDPVAGPYHAALAMGCDE